MNKRSNLRASDADREQIADRLRDAAAEGRLLASELEERIARALRARTYGELDAIVADLPHGVAVPRAPKGDLARWMKPAVVVAVAVPLAIVAVAIVAAAAMFVLSGIAATWFVWVFLAWFVFGHRHPHSHPHRRRGRSARYGSPRRARVYPF